MAKLRNHKTDIGGFTQWLGRKCRNHNPLSEAEKRPNGRQSLRVRAGGELHNRIVYEARGRTFLIEVTDISGDAFALGHLENEGLVEVGV